MSIADRMSGSGSSTAKPERGVMLEQDAGGEKTTIMHHPDGKHSVEHSDGESSGPHDQLHEAMAHISMKHHPEEAHSHVMHNEDGGHTSHHAKDGEVTGPHEHENLEALKSHMGKMLGEEGHEGEHDDGMWEG